MSQWLAWLRCSPAHAVGPWCSSRWRSPSSPCRASPCPLLAAAISARTSPTTCSCGTPVRPTSLRSSSEPRLHLLRSVLRWTSAAVWSPSSGWHCSTPPPWSPGSWVCVVLGLTCLSSRMAAWLLLYRVHGSSSTVFGATDFAAAFAGWWSCSTARHLGPVLAALPPSGSGIAFLRAAARPGGAGPVRAVPSARRRPVAAPPHVGGGRARRSRPTARGAHREQRRALRQ